MIGPLEERVPGERGSRRRGGCGEESEESAPGDEGDAEAVSSGESRRIDAVLREDKRCGS